MTAVFAHRGSHQQHRENTLAAFGAARALGVQGVELDVRRTSDAHLVVHHDPACADQVIAYTRAADLPAYVPHLEEALEELRGLIVNVEIKNSRDPGEPVYDESGSFVAQVLDLLHERDATTTSTISCFDVATCAQVRDYDRDINVAWLLGRVEVASALTQAHVLGLNGVNPYYLTLQRSDMELAHSLDLEVNVWTVNRDEDLTTMLDLEVTRLITDEPARALALVAARSPVPGDGLD